MLERITAAAAVTEACTLQAVGEEVRLAAPVKEALQQQAAAFLAYIFCDPFCVLPAATDRIFAVGISPALLAATILSQ